MVKKYSATFWTWGADVLGEGFTRRSMMMKDGFSATLVRYKPKRTFRQQRSAPLRSVSLLYVHGWSDYFFQRELAQVIAAAGVNFYALDLRHYGRNLPIDAASGRSTIPSPGFTTSLDDYSEEFDAAINLINKEHRGTKLVILGHSTGGLSAALYAAANPGKVHALALNSPWLEFQASELGRTALSRLMQAGSMLNPHLFLPSVDPGFYTRTVSSQFEGEWDYDMTWRPVNGFKITTGFINAVFAAQSTVSRGLGLQIPVMVMLSAKDYLLPRWDDSASRSDVALNVQAVAQRSLDLGNELYLVRLNDALHDVFLSAPEVRSTAYWELTSWLVAIANRGKDTKLAANIEAIMNPEAD
ncbi:alpha/beta hydrolase [Glutamicibacter sp.]|uniref:alpha/beta hydrolase n=1 Tax=Glutamicibacter sp. TaxID=1931995 RepID=UPI0028BD4B55|nr:alpha/beta hydrolase [Glutamicibacter sp.]